MSVHQTVIKPDPSLLVDSPGTPTFMSDSEAESEPLLCREFSRSPPSARSSSRRFPSMDQGYADEDQDDIPCWQVELRYGQRCGSRNYE